MSDAEESIIERYERAKRNLDLISGVCFLICLIVCPTLYFIFGGFVFILFLPVFLLLIIEILATLALMVMKSRALKRLANVRSMEESRTQSEYPAETNEPKKMPKRISGIVTIPQHEHALQLAQIHYAYPPPRYDQLQRPPPYQMVILSAPVSSVQPQENSNLRF
ncbi:Hypothetical predicted protein [Cloeon dipterum]|uniref:Transmembrane protein n=1 Tax=Cloeon dipterum TaxID=197152 RepID=A0A8S1DPG4_9INSE|nr:Hypothetical predicted protein [Cloeon dipterum]